MTEVDFIDVKGQKVARSHSPRKIAFSEDGPVFPQGNNRTRLPSLSGKQAWSDEQNKDQLGNDAEPASRRRSKDLPDLHSPRGPNGSNGNDDNSKPLYIRKREEYERKLKEEENSRMEERLKKRSEGRVPTKHEIDVHAEKLRLMKEEQERRLKQGEEGRSQSWKSRKIELDQKRVSPARISLATISKEFFPTDSDPYSPRRHSIGSESPSRKNLSSGSQSPISIKSGKLWDESSVDTATGNNTDDNNSEPAIEDRLHLSPRRPSNNNNNNDNNHHHLHNTIPVRSIHTAEPRKSSLIAPRKPSNPHVWNGQGEKPLYVKVEEELMKRRIAEDEKVKEQRQKKRDQDKVPDRQEQQAHTERLMKMKLEQAKRVKLEEEARLTAWKERELEMQNKVKNISLNKPSIESTVVVTPRPSDSNDGEGNSRGSSTPGRGTAQSRSRGNTPSRSSTAQNASRKSTTTTTTSSTTTITSTAYYSSYSPSFSTAGMSGGTAASGAIPVPPVSDKVQKPVTPKAPGRSNSTSTSQTHTQIQRKVTVPIPVTASQTDMSDGGAAAPPAVPASSPRSLGTPKKRPSYTFFIEKQQENDPSVRRSSIPIVPRKSSKFTDEMTNAALTTVNEESAKADTGPMNPTQAPPAVVPVATVQRRISKFDKELTESDKQHSGASEPAADSVEKSPKASTKGVVFSSADSPRSKRPSLGAKSAITDREVDKMQAAVGGGGGSGKSTLPLSPRSRQGSMDNGHKFPPSPRSRHGSIDNAHTASTTAVASIESPRTRNYSLKAKSATLDKESDKLRELSSIPSPRAKTSTIATNGANGSNKEGFGNNVETPRNRKLSLETKSGSLEKEADKIRATVSSLPTPRARTSSLNGIVDQGPLSPRSPRNPETPKAGESSSHSSGSSIPSPRGRKGSVTPFKSDTGFTSPRSRKTSVVTAAMYSADGETKPLFMRLEEEYAIKEKAKMESIKEELAKRRRRVPTRQEIEVHNEKLRSLKVDQEKRAKMEEEARVRVWREREAAIATRIENPNRQTLIPDEDFLTKLREAREEQEKRAKQDEEERLKLWRERRAEILSKRENPNRPGLVPTVSGEEAAMRRNRRRKSRVRMPKGGEDEFDMEELKARALRTQRELEEMDDDDDDLDYDDYDDEEDPEFHQYLLELEDDLDDDNAVRGHKVDTPMEFFVENEGIYEGADEGNRPDAFDPETSFVDKIIDM